MVKRLVLLVLGVVLAPLLVVVMAPPSSAVPCGAACYPGPRYKVYDLKTYTQQTLYALGEIGSCQNPGGTCTISKVTSKTTQVGTALGLSKGAVAASINVSLSKTSSTSVACNSPRLKRGQIYRAYVRGVYKTYKIKKTYAGHTWYSGTLKAREPYKLSIHCRVESL